MCFLKLFFHYLLPIEKSSLLGISEAYSEHPDVRQERPLLCVTKTTVDFQRLIEDAEDFITRVSVCQYETKNAFGLKLHTCSKKENFILQFIIFYKIPLFWFYLF